MRRLLFALLSMAVGALMFASVASAHYITSQSMTCQGLTFSYANFPEGQTQFTLTWKYDSTTVKTQVIDEYTNGSGTVGPISLPSVPANGTDVQAYGSWTVDGGGSFDASQTLSCQPTVTTASVDCTGYHFTWTSNLPSPSIEVVWKSPSGWGSTTVQESGTSGSTTVPLPQTPPNGTVITVVDVWNGGGTQPVSSAPTACIPVPPPTPPTPPTPPKPVPPAPTPPTPTPPAPPKHHHHKPPPKPHAVSISLQVRYFNQDPQPVVRMLVRGHTAAAQYGCRIVGPPASQQHGLVHFQVRCRNAKVLSGWTWSVDGQTVRNEHWTYTSDGGRQLNSWLFDRGVWGLPHVYGYYTITAKGKVRGQQPSTSAPAKPAEK